MHLLGTSLFKSQLGATCTLAFYHLVSRAHSCNSSYINMKDCNIVDWSTLQVPCMFHLWHFYFKNFVLTGIHLMSNYLIFHINKKIISLNQAFKAIDMQIFI